MQKFVRSFALVAILALTTTPAMFAGRAGCDPHPDPGSGDGVGPVIVVVIGSLLGF